MRMAVGRLPELLKQAVLLVYFQGLKYQDAADILDIPVGTVKSRLHAALTKLTEDWDGGESELELEGGAQEIENLVPARFISLRSGVRKP